MKLTMLGWGRTETSDSDQKLIEKMCTEVTD